ncbi:uncharacterized protein LOC112046433 [Bicyclus anynana]|uniref:Uncharacterized protein LOC112046433 n=1 Tax=Bicyclus anynana TaxID=110368 RepID=A0ABM3LYM0_BICAN|nr:uncharacterized protein LOC112046433 [Bicyclus anynana]
MYDLRPLRYRLSNERAVCRAAGCDHAATNFLGKWHVVRRTDKPRGPIDCSQLELLEENDEIFLHERVVNQNFLEHERSPAIYEEGTAKFNINRTDPYKSADFWILQTDYNNLALAYACEDDEDGTTSRVTIWQLGRQPFFPNTMMEAFMNTTLFNNFGITRDDLTPVDHSEAACKTLPEIPPGQNVVLPGQCNQTMAVVENFNVSSFMGEWFEISSYFTANQLGACSRAKYTLTEDGVAVENSQVVNETLEIIPGRAILTTTDESARLLVTLEIRPTVFVDSPLWILATDYENYAVSYTCIDLANNQKQVNAWILSRSRQLTHEAQTAVNEVIRSEVELNKRFFVEADQSDEACFYYPQPVAGQPVIFRGQCDLSISVKTDFNATAYMGLWHNIESYPSKSQTGTCNNALYRLKDDFVDVFNTQVVDEKLLSINGEARVASSDGSAKLTVNFPIAGTNTFSTASYWVLETDYESFALVYSCVNIDDEHRQVTSWKLSRTKELPPAGAAAIDRIIPTIPVLDQQYFEKHDQSRKGCFYFPEPRPGVPVVFPGQCSDTNVQVATNFNFTGFEGTWNEIRAYPKEQQPGQCVSHAFTATSSGFNLVTSSVEDQFLGTSNSSVTQTTTDGTAKFSITFKGIDGDITIPYWILDTDYLNYALAYSCVDVNSDFRAVYSWKLSRTRQLSADASNSINSVIQNINVLQERYFETVDQTDAGCFYLPQLQPGEPVILNGRCDENIPVIQDFDLNAYLGRWRLIESYASDFQTGSCKDTTYSLGSNNILLQNTQVIDQRLDITTGTAVNFTTDGRLFVLAAGQSNQYLILDTDYTSFALVYTCNNINEHQRRVWSWKLSRTTTLSDKAHQRMNPIINRIDVLNNQYFHPVDHSDSGCFYYPSPNPGNPVIFRGQCDTNIKAVANFNVSAYMNLWHDVASYPNGFQRGTCPNALYTLNANETVDVFNTEVISQRLDTLRGIGEIASGDGSAQLSVRFPIAGSTLFRTAPYWVLATDYNDYALVYSCVNINEEQRQVWSWKLSRTKQLSQTAVTEIGKVTSNIPVLRDEYYVQRDQSRNGCFYFPEPEPGVPVVFPGQCDTTIQAIASFNMTAFQGQWHEIAAYPKEQQTGQCISHQYSLGNNNNLNLVSNNVQNQNLGVTNSVVSFESAQDTSGRLIITLSSNGQVIIIPFWVLDTDYENYALAYSCVNVNNDYRKVFSWKLSRTRELNSAAKIAINNKIATIDVLEDKYYEPIDQSDTACFYLPTPIPDQPVEFPGQCDETIGVVQNFNAEAYLGRWRLIQSYPQKSQTGTCNEANYSLNPDGSTVDVYNTQVINQELDSINGTAILAANDGNAKLLVTFPNSPEPAPYWVLDTDYVSFALVYSCRNIDTYRRQVTSWKLSRTSQLTPSAVERINLIVNKINVLNEKYFSSIDHSDKGCFYFPPPSPNPVIFRGQCDQNIPVVTNFDVLKYTGLWHDIASYPNEFQEGTCSNAYYSLVTNYVTVRNTQVINQTQYVIEGEARTAYADGSAKLIVRFPIAGTNEFTDSTYWVLRTDYISYSLVYTCANLDTERRQVWSWILSRSKELSSGAITEINQAIATVPVLDDRYYIQRNLSREGCFYFPEPKPGVPVEFPGQCDMNIQAIANFNMTAFQGMWHEIEAYPKEQQTGHCVNHDYSIGTANTLNLVSSNVLDETLSITNSQVTFASPQDTSGRLVITLTSGGSVINIPFWVIQTDYESYALAYSCVNINNDYRRVFSWKLSRSQQLTTGASAAITNAMQDIDVLQEQYFEEIKQTDEACFYLPDPVPGVPVTFRGKCDESVPVVQNFNASRYLGRWRRISSYPEPSQIGKCNEATYSLNADGSTVDVYNTQVINRELDSINGTAILASNDGSAKLLVTFPNTTEPAPYWVLDTDYDTFALVYSCRNLPNNQRRVWSWKLSRTTTLTNAAVTAINTAAASIPVLDDRYYVTRDHSDQGCFYYPEPEPGKPVVFPGQCDDTIQAVANFNMTAFQGVWHEIAAYPKEYQTGQCINHEYSLGSAGYLDLVSSNVVNEILGVTNSRVTSVDSSGKLVITLNYEGTTITIPFWILDINYNDYALAYSCVNINARQREVYSWKLSRSKELSSSAVISIDNKISEIDVLHEKYFEKIDQSDNACFFLPDILPGQPVIFNGQCDSNIPVLQNFNAIRYLGRWRVIESYASDFQSLAGGCLEANYKLGSNNTINIDNTEVVNQNLYTETGTAILDGTDGSGKFIVTFPNAPDSSNLWVLDTDYDTYALVYSCVDINDQQRRVWSWKLSRAAELTTNAQTKIENIVNSINVLNNRFYVKINQTDEACFYYPTPDGNPVEFRGLCDENVPVVTDFKAADYMGLWYSIESYPTFNARGTCGNAHYTLGDGVVEVFNTQVIDQRLDTINGTATLVPTNDTSAKLTVRFPVGGNINESPYWVLATDYKSYSLVYTCINLSSDRRRVSSWKLSRSKQLTAEAVRDIDIAISKVPVLDDKYYVKSDQSDASCFYYPEPQPGVPVVFRGQCDNTIQAVPNFNMNTFQGVWHEVEAYPKEQQTGQCINHEYTLGSSNALDLVSSNIINQIRGITNSRVTFTSPQDTSGKLTITLTSGTSTITIPFWVLSTDYEDYALAYSCINLDQYSRGVFSWKLSRSQQLSTAGNTAINNKIKEIDVLDNQYYEEVDQSDKACFYLPDIPPGVPVEFVGQCDETLAVVQNFDASAYGGRWRMIETYVSDFQSLQGGCKEATYTLAPGAVVDVYNTDVVNQRLYSINGTAVLASTDGSAKLSVSFPGNQEPASYWVLDTDYTSYALVYSCRNIENGRRRVWSWKLSRTRELTNNAITKINERIATIDVLNERFYLKVEHSDDACFYYPTPDGNPLVFRGQCDPNIPVVTGFNATAYMDTWYDIEGYPVQFQDGTCPTATYSLTAAGVDVFNTQVVRQELDTIRGTAVLATDDGSAKLTVSFPIAGTNLKTASPYWVLSTDYSNYALVYSCVNTDTEHRRVASWKLSRTKQLTEASKAEIDKVINTVPVLRQDYYVPRGHTEENCFYYPDNYGGPVIQNGQCDINEINIVEKFDINAFSGAWYEISRFPSELQDGECVSNDFIINNGIIQMRKSIVYNDMKTTFTGPVTLDPDERGVMKVTLNDPVAGGIFEMTFHVLDVVYNDFALLYGCRDVDSTRKQIYSWKLSRSSTTLSETAVTRINQIVNDTRPLFERYFEETDQTSNGCFHYPDFDELPSVIELTGHCDTSIRGKANFDVAAYLGKWYEIASYPQPFQYGQCARAQYSLGDGVVNVLNTQVVNQTLDVQMATAVLGSDDGSGLLHVTFNLPNGVTNVVNYYVLETDYKNFALVYSCRNLTNDRRQVTSWKLSRETSLSDEALLIMDEIINSTQGLRQSFYRPTSQTEDSCFYIPEVNKNEAPEFRGQCGDISGIQGFDAKKYIGWWHEIESYPTNNDRGACISSEFSQLNDGYHIVDTNVFDNVAELNSSTVTVTNDGRLRKTYSNGGYDDIWILATDYETYSLLYSCENIDSQSMRVWSAKYSKSRQLTPAAREAIDQYINSTRTLETQFYQVVDQSDSVCFHYPEPTGNQIIIPGQCDLNIPVEQNFDVSEYSGTWYQIERYPQVHENGTCIGARYTLDQNTGVVTVLNWQVIDGVLDTVEGTARINSTDGSAKLIVNLPIRFTEGKTEPTMVSTELYVLKTDYLTHSLAYSCVNVGPYRRAVGVWKLSRTRELDDESKSAIDAITALRPELHQPYFNPVTQNDDCAEPSSAVIVKSSIIIMLLCSIIKFLL